MRKSPTEAAAIGAHQQVDGATRRAGNSAPKGQIEDATKPDQVIPGHCERRQHGRYRRAGKTEGAHQCEHEDRVVARKRTRP